MILIVFLVLLLAPPSAATVPHQATLYYQSPACTTASPCTLTVFRASCPTATTCPAYGNGHGWARISPTVTATVTATGGTAWVVKDQDPTLKDATTYVYAAATTWKSGSPYSGASPLWSGTTSNGGSTGVPNVPTVGTGNSVH